MLKKQRSGVVVSDKMDKTVVVQVERSVAHPLYGKALRRRKRYKAHDETNVCRLGDQVLIEEDRPLSKQKHWRVVRVVERHEVAEIQPREIDAEMTGVPRRSRSTEIIPDVSDEGVTENSTVKSEESLTDTTSTNKEDSAL